MGATEDVFYESAYKIRVRIEIEDAELDQKKTFEMSKGSSEFEDCAQSAVSEMFIFLDTFGWGGSWIELACMSTAWACDKIGVVRDGEISATPAENRFIEAAIAYRDESCPARRTAPAQTQNQTNPESPS